MGDDKVTPRPGPVRTFAVTAFVWWVLFVLVSIALNTLLGDELELEKWSYVGAVWALAITALTPVFRRRYGNG
jgi:hypothetical protein